MKTLVTLSFFLLKFSFFGSCQYYQLSLNTNFLSFDSDSKIGQYRFENDSIFVETVFPENGAILWEDALPYKLHPLDNRTRYHSTKGAVDGVYYFSFLTWNDSVVNNPNVHLTVLKADFIQEQLTFWLTDTMQLQSPICINTISVEDTSILYSFTGVPSGGGGSGAFYRASQAGVSQISPAGNIFAEVTWQHRNFDEVTQWVLTGSGQNTSFIRSINKLDGTALYFGSSPYSPSVSFPLFMEVVGFDTVRYFTVTPQTSSTAMIKMHHSNLRGQDYTVQSVSKGQVLGFSPTIASVLCLNDTLYAQYQGQTSQYNDVVLYDMNLNEICTEFVQFTGKTFYLKEFLGEPYYVITTPGQTAKEYRRVSASCSIMSSESNNQQLVELQLYPNPTDRLIQISGIKENVEVEYEVMNELGQVLFKGVMNHGEIELSDLSNGVYFVRLNHSGQTKLFQVEKN